VRAVKPDVIVNAAAYTAVDKAESEPELAHNDQRAGPRRARRGSQLRSLGAWLVHYSTDYVFDGSGDDTWLETDATGAAQRLRTNQAGRRTGRCRLRQAPDLPHQLGVCRARRNNFRQDHAAPGEERDQLKVIADQIGAPTGAELLSRCHRARHSQRSRQQASARRPLPSGGRRRNQLAWLRPARHRLRPASRRAIRVAAAAIEAVPSSAYPLPAPRPHNSRLDTRKLQAAFDLRLPDWQVGVDRMLVEVLGQ
jgi:dTDP-4-dehydrorhamnose reductase